MSDARSLIKGLGNGAGRVALAPLVAAMRAEQLALGPDKSDEVFQAYSQAASLVPGLVGLYARRAFYAMALPSCGRDFTVGFGTVFSKQGATVGDRVYVGMWCIVGHALLEDHVTIGSHVDILSGRTQHGTGDPEAPVQDQKGVYSAVTIGRNSWIGNGAIIMADVGRSCVVGAGSVVVKPLPDRVVAVGNPARVVRER